MPNHYIVILGERWHGLISQFFPMTHLSHADSMETQHSDTLNISESQLEIKINVNIMVKYLSGV